MRKPQLSAVLILILLASVAALARTAPGKGSTATFVPPAEPGLIYTVINYSRAGGMAPSGMPAVSYVFWTAVWLF